MDVDLKENMDIAAHYKALHENSGKVLLSALADESNLATLTVAHNYLLEFDLLGYIISDRPEIEVLQCATKEYQLALHALATGQYRYAFTGLRLFFELMLVAVQFSAHEIDFRMWKRSSKDLNWSALKDVNTGIFAVNFINAFNPEFSRDTKQYLSIAETVYRECSEYVHGNAQTHSELPKDILFSQEVFSAWHQKASAMRLVITFVFAARYLNYINKEKQEAVEPLFLDTLGHLVGIQAVFAKPD